jgi:hypothetical protein
MKIHELFEDDRLRFLKDKSPEEVVELLKSECSEIYNLYKSTGFKNLFFRGEKDANDKYEPFKAGIYQNRIPVQMDPKLHETFNAAMMRVGLGAHRGNSIFTSSNFIVAADWGNTCIVFPTNGFKYTWFKDMKTTYIFHDIKIFSETVYHLENVFDDLSKRFPTKDLIVKRRINKIKEADTKEGEDYRTIFKHGFEGNKPVSKEKFKNNLWDDFILNNVKGTDEDLKYPLTHKGEVLFSNCEYYGIPIRGVTRNNDIIQALKNEI